MVPLPAIDPAIISRLEALIAIQAAPIIILGVWIVRPTSTGPSDFEEIIHSAGACPGLVLIPRLFSRPSVCPRAIVPGHGYHHRRRAPRARHCRRWSVRLGYRYPGRRVRRSRRPRDFPRCHRRLLLLQAIVFR